MGDTGAVRTSGGQERPAKPSEPAAGGPRRRRGLPLALFVGDEPEGDETPGDRDWDDGAA